MNFNSDHKKIRLIMELRNQGIKDTDVLSAMENVPREAFVPDDQKPRAWENTALPIGRGQTISQPLVVAMMTEALKLTKKDKVLEIGTGCGYQAAVLSKLCRRVYTIERHKPLLKEAEQRFRKLGLDNITAIAGDGMKGWPTINGIDQAPFDKIICTAAAKDRPPEAFIEQLKDGGLLVLPVGPSGEQVLRRYKKESAESYSYKDLLPVRFVPLLPEMAGDDENA